MLEYFEDTKLFRKFFTLSKMHNKFILDHPESCQNILFRIPEFRKNIDKQEQKEAMKKKFCFGKKDYLYVYKMKLNFYEGFEERIFKKFGNLKHLEVEWDVNVYYLTDGMFQFLPKLEYLKCNKVNAMHGKTLNQLKSLRKIDISYNSKITDEEFMDLKELKSLKISNITNINGDLMEYLGNQLKELTIAYASNSFDVEKIQFAQELESLSFQFSFFSFNFQDLVYFPLLKKFEIWNLPKIKRIDLPKLFQNQLTHLSLANLRLLNDNNFEFCINLSSLTIFNCRNVCYSALENMKKLEILRIFDTKGKLSTKTFDDNAHLYHTIKKLALWNCPNFTGKNLKKFRCLRHLYLRDCSLITAEEIKKTEKLNSLEICNAERIKRRDYDEIRIWGLDFLQRTKYEKKKKNKKKLKLKDIFSNEKQLLKKKQEKKMIKSFKEF